MEDLFAGRPRARELFEAVRTLVESLGPCTVAFQKSQVAFRAPRPFAWVWLPQKWVRNRPEGSVTLTFALRRAVGSPRLAEVVEPRPGRFTHHLVIEREEELDEEVTGWLEEARRGS